MATVLNAFDDDQNNQNQGSQAPSTPAAPPTIGGPQGGGVSTPGSGSSSGASPTAPTSSGSFNNIQKYLDANKDFNSGNGGLAGKVVSNINDQAHSTQDNLIGAQNTFKNQADQSAATFTNPDLVNQAFQDPTKFAQDQGNVDKFAQIRDASYSGPKSLSDLQGNQNLSNLQLQASNVNNNVQQGQTESGRYNLLNQMFGKNNYSKGQQNLDNLLIQGDKNQLGQLQNTRQIATDTSRALNNVDQSTSQQAQQYQQQAADVQKDVRGKLNQGVLDENADLTNRLAAAKTDQQNAVDTFNSRFNQGHITAADAQRFGLSAGQQLFGVNPSQYITPNVNLNAQTIASQDDYNKFAALNKLMGGQSNVPGAVANEATSSILSQYNDPSQAGAYAAGGKYNLDTNALLGAINSQKASYDDQTSDINKARDTATNTLNSNYIDHGNNFGGRSLTDLYNLTHSGNLTLANYNKNPSAYQGLLPLLNNSNAFMFNDINGAYEGNQSQLADANQKYAALQNMLGKQLQIIPDEEPQT